MLKKYPHWFEAKKDVLKHFGIDVDYVPEPNWNTKRSLFQEFTEKTAQGSSKVDGVI